MDEIELRAIVSSHVSSATGFLDSEITQEREKGLKYYRGDPFGDERDDHSKVVSKDVMDTVEWILPNLVRIFMGTRRIAEFAPVGVEDIPLSRQQTDYVNHVIRTKNPGFMVFYTWLKDGLIQKVGIVKHFYGKKTKTDTVTYEGLTEDELAFVITENEARADEVKVVEQSQEGERTIAGETIETFSVKLRRVYQKKQVFLENIPPEEFLISRRAKSIHDADFVAQKTEKTRSELISEGFPKKDIEALSAKGHDDMTGEEETRFEDEDDISPNVDSASEKVDVIEAYLKIDFDGDGIAELRQVILSGMTILSNEEIDEIPFSAWTPIPMPHRSEVAGMSAADAVMDLQLIKSTIMRGLLDWVYTAVEPQMEVVWDQVNHDDALTNRRGGIKRVNQPGMYNPLSQPINAGPIFDVLQYLEEKQAGRTGVSATTTGIDAEVLKSHQTKGAVEKVMSMAQQRIDLIARVFAETGLRNLMTQVLKLVVKHQNATDVFRLREEFIPVDPREWYADKDLEIESGLGLGDKDGRIAFLNQTLAYQFQAWQDKTLGMVRPKSMYNTLEKLIALSDEPSAEPFFDDPESPQGQKNRQDGIALMQVMSQGNSDAEAFVQGEQIKAQTDLQEANAKLQLELLKLRQKDDFDRDKLESEIILKASEIMGKHGVQVDLALIKAEMDRERNGSA